MLRWRRHRFPPAPRSLQEFGMVLTLANESGILEYYRGRMVCANIVDNNNQYHVCLRDVNFLQTKFSHINTIILDGTFQTRPNIEGCTQVFTVMGVKNDHVSLFNFFFSLCFLLGVVNTL